MVRIRLLSALLVIGLLTAVSPDLALAVAPRCESVFTLPQAGAEADSANPYSLSYDVRQLSRNQHDFESQISSLQNILNEPAGEKRARDMETWTQSEAHALFLYDSMVRLGLQKFQNDLKYLRENSVYFVDSHLSGSALITYAFEKEGSSSDISLLFRPPEISDENWFHLTEEQRMKALREIKVPMKTFTKADLVAPTGLKPEAVGGYSQEIGGKNWREYGWEISHKKYEINEQRLMREVKDLADFFKQTDSFHVHVVSELPRNYKDYENFIYWYKHGNDYLYLKGLEEGLHGNYLTGVANLNGDLSWSERIRGWLRLFYSNSEVIEEKQDQLGKRNSKFFSAGLRAGIYGSASSPENMKIGIELRDTTRNMDLLEKFVAKYTLSLENRIWEGASLSDVRKEGLRLTSDRPTARDSLSSVVGPKYAKIFAEQDAAVYFGLIRYEDANIYNYKTKSWVQITPDVRQRLQNARAGYEHDLVALEAELREKEAKGEKVEKEIIKIALRMSLAAWAKQAKASELFENY